MNHSTFKMHSRRFYRDSQHRLIFGVCAGLAEYFELPVWLVRVVAVVLAWYFLVPAVIAYLIAALLMPKKPSHFYSHTDKRAFWRNDTRRD